MQVIVKRAADSDLLRWNDYVDSSSSGTIYHRFEWRRILYEGYGLLPEYIYAETEGKICGVLPLVWVPKLNPLKKVLFSLPYADFAGVDAENEEIQKQLVGYAEEMAEGSGCDLVIRQKGKELEGVAADTGNILQVVDISGAGDDLLGMFNSNMRRKIRKSFKNGIELLRGHDQFDGFYEVYSRNMHALGTPKHSDRFMREILRNLSSFTEVFVCRLEGKPVGGMFTLKYKDSARDPWTSSLRGYNHLYVAYQLYYNALSFARENNMNCFDFGRSQNGSGVYNFKAQWGAADVPLYYHNFSGDNRNIKDSTSMGLISKIWSKLPYALVDEAGTVLRKFIP